MHEHESNQFTIPQLERLWDIAAGSTAKLVYLCAADRWFDAETMLMMNLVVALDECPVGRYPHSIAREWIQEGFNVEQARPLMRMGFYDAETVREKNLAGIEPLKLVQ